MNTTTTMSMTTTPDMATLHLLHTRPDLRHLAAWAIRHGLVQPVDDAGYALHALLHAVFGAMAPRPFHHGDDGQGLLAYLLATPEAVARCVALAEPDAAAALGLVTLTDQATPATGYSLRPFPAVWPAGHVLGFDVRVRPILRTAKGERDAYLSALDAREADDPLEAIPPPDRAEVYAQWLRRQLAVRETGGIEPWQGAVELLDIRMTRYQRLQVMRKTQREDGHGARLLSLSAGPDVELSGHLRVVDPAGFAVLLARGVGRHRAFGFGMLRLRPARR
ncbi:type I-E CRISPR-associated protein Cas6/Cse3/CasE [Leptothrix sp. BB-4]